MKKLLLLVTLLSCYSLSHAQTPAWLWAENSNGGDWENGVGISIDTANHLYLSGRAAGTVTFGGTTITTSCGSYSDNPIMGELDTAGNAIWLNTYEYSCGNDYTEGFGRDNYDNTYSTGIIGSNCCGMFVDKYDKNGNLKWPLPLGSNSGSAGLGVAADNAGYVYVCGTEGSGTVTVGSVSMPYTGSSQSIILFKLDSLGNAIWGRAINGATTIDGDDQARDVIVDNKGYIYVIGDYTGSPVFGTLTAPASTADKNFFLAKYDTAGNLIWLNTVNDAWATDDFGGTSGVVIDSCGNLYVTGLFANTSYFGANFSLTSAGGQDMFVARCDNNGNWQWVQSAGGASDDQGQAIAIDKNSDIYVAGYSTSGGLNFGNGVSTSSGDIFVAKYSNGNGAAQWAQSATANSGVGAITVDKSKYVYVYGSIGGGSATFGNITLTLSSTQNIVLAKLDTVVSRTIVPVIKASYCPGSVDTITYSITGTFNSGNVFTVQLSDSTGSFVNDTSIGSVTSTTGGQIIITIPANTPTGSNYLIRVVSSNPSASSFFNGCGSYFVNNVYLNNFYVTIGGSGLTPSIFASTDTICSGGAVTLKVSGGTGSYTWNNGASGDSIVVRPTIDSTYVVTTGTGACSGSAFVNITVNQANPLPSSTQNVCAGSGVVLTVPASGSNYVWTPDSTLNTYTGDTVIASPNSGIIYTVTGLDSLGCQVTGYDTINIIFGPNKPTITISVTGDSLISSAGSYNQWYFNGSFIDSTRQVLVIKGHAHGYYKVSVTNPANGCSTTSDSTTSINQLSAISEQLSVYPNPFNNYITVKINSSAQNVNEWSLQLTDVLGRTLYTEPSLNYSNDIDLANLPAGVYFITVTHNTARAVLPVVKQN